MSFRRCVTSRRRSLCADYRRYVPSRIRYVPSVVRYEPLSFVANRCPCHVPIARRYVPCFRYVPILFVTYRFRLLCSDRYVPTVMYRSLVPFLFCVAACSLVCGAVFGYLPVVIGTSGTHGTSSEAVRTEE